MAQVQLFHPVDSSEALWNTFHGFGNHVSLTAAAVTISMETWCLPWRALKMFSLLPLTPSPLLLLHPPVISWLAADSGFIPVKLSLVLASCAGEG